MTNQEIRRKLVDREIIYNVNTFIFEFASKDEYSEELSELLGKFDYSENEEDPEYIEALEFYIVTDYFAEKLKEKDEIVVDFMGLTIWGRTCTGQAILLDSVIKEIAKDMEILNGQQYEWK